MSQKIKRSQFRTFIDIDPGYEEWALLGEGVTTAQIDYNPEISSETYIHQDSAAAEIESYAPSMPIEASAIAGDDVFKFVDGLRKERAVLDAAHTQIVNVWLYEDEQGTGIYPAELQDVTIAVGNIGGAGGESNKINFTIHFRGDPAAGAFNISNLTFTPDS